MDTFSHIAPYLSNPLILIGFSLFLLIGLFKTLIKSGIAPQLTKKAGREVVNKILLYGFITSLLIILTGFVSNMVKFFATEQQSSNQNQAPLIPKTDLIPFNIGWVLVGSYNPKSETFVDGSYLRLVYRPDTTKKDYKTPVIGDIYQVTKDRNVIIKKYKIDGLRNQFVSPLDFLNNPTDKVAILTDDDYTGIVIPKNTLIVITETDIGDRRPNDLAAVWSLVSVCHPDSVTCQEAVKILERQGE